MAGARLDAGAVGALGVGSGARASHPWAARSVEALAVCVAVAAIAVGASARTATVWVASCGVAIWSLSGLVCAARRAISLGMLLVASGAVVLVAVAAHEADYEWLTATGVALIPAVVLVLALSLPDGRLQGARRWILAVAGLVVAAVAIPAIGSDLELGAVAAESVVLGAVAALEFTRSCRAAGAVHRARLQMQAVGALITAVVCTVALALAALLDWPSSPGIVCLAATAAIPAAIAASTVPAATAHADRLLVHAIVSAGLSMVVGSVYLAVVIGFGSTPAKDERALLGLSVLAGLVAVILAGPTRRRLYEVANERVYGERHAPDEAMRTFGGRMSRAVPMDELLLQLVESLKKTMNLDVAEIWTGTGGVLDLAVSVPARSVPPRITLTGEEIAVVTRARVQGNAWLQVWVPELLDGRGSQLVRVVSVAHLGELHGVIVLERAADGTPFSDEEETALAELARQVGLALHNVKLDSALQASLEELADRNAELEASRKRIVAASDDARRKIERNLHDGAQQHLVALAVKVSLVKDLLAGDPTTASTMLDELRLELQTTLGELRELAHGIYPPLLRDRGLVEALRAAANRSPLQTVVQCDLEDRLAPDVEAAVYFCCVEAIQNAAKHAGDGATISLSVVAEDEELTFVVADDGVGFDVASGAAEGHGFVNMRDRLGAISGELVVSSTPGVGARIEGRVPLQ